MTIYISQGRYTAAAIKGTVQDARSSTRGMSRGLFGRDDLMAAHSKSVSSHTA
jgi:hypothetical protein